MLRHWGAKSSEMECDVTAHPCAHLTFACSRNLLAIAPKAISQLPAVNLKSRRMVFFYEKLQLPRRRLTRGNISVCIRPSTSSSPPSFANDTLPDRPL